MSQASQSGDRSWAAWLCAALVLLLVSAGCLRRAVFDEGSDVVVYVVDSPADYDFVEGRGRQGRTDPVSHGSLVARVARSYFPGRVEVVPVADGSAGVDQDSYIAALRSVLERVRARTDGRSVVNVSLASVSSSEEEHALVRGLLDAGALVVAAAGNGGVREKLYPAGYPGVVAVGSVHAGERTPSSSYGRHLAICASGDVTFFDTEFSPALIPWLQRITRADGTSFAAPRVAGTAARLMARHPRMAPRDAVARILDTAEPLRDPAYDAGLLGAGALDVEAALSVGAPGYHFVNVVLPIATWVVLGLLCLWLTVRLRLPGVFLSLMVWLVALPLAVLLVLQAQDLLLVMGAGRRWAGVAGVGAMLLAALVGLRIQAGNVRKTALCIVPPCLLAVAVRVSGLDPLPAPWGALAASGVGVLLAGVLEWRTRRVLESLAEVRAGTDLAHVHMHAWDERLQRAALGHMGRVADADCVEYLLALPELARAGVVALRRIAATRPELLEDAAPATFEGRERADRALRQARGGAAGG